MSEREVVLDPPVIEDESQHLQAAIERAERAEAELARLKGQAEGSSASAGDGAAVQTAAGDDASVSGNAAAEGRASAGSDAGAADKSQAHALHAPALRGAEALREDAMMRHLLESLEAGKDIGHYGRLTFSMVGRHFLSHAEVLAELTKGRDFSEAQAEVMLTQVEDRDYSPPRRERIAEWQSQQEFPILPQPHDPDCGNVYRTLHFPDKTYQHIEGYREEQMQA